jgi:hypothetical protein
MDQATATADRIGDLSLTGYVLLCKALAHVTGGEPEAVLEPGEHALTLIPEEALADRAELMAHLLVANYH